MSSISHTAFIRPGQRHVVRLIAVVAPLLAAAVAACSSATGPSVCSGQPNFNLQGTWQGAAPHATLTVTLGKQQVFYFGCGGTINAGSYADSTINLQGEFAPAGNYYKLVGPGGGTTLYMASSDSFQVAVGFMGVLSDTTKNVFSGTVIFQNASQGLSDTVAITMVRQ